MTVRWLRSEDSAARRQSADATFHRAVGAGRQLPNPTHRSLLSDILCAKGTLTSAMRTADPNPETDQASRGEGSARLWTQR